MSGAELTMLGLQAFMPQGIACQRAILEGTSGDYSSAPVDLIYLAKSLPAMSDIGSHCAATEFAGVMHEAEFPETTALKTSASGWFDVIHGMLPAAGTGVAAIVVAQDPSRRRMAPAFGNQEHEMRGHTDWPNGPTSCDRFADQPLQRLPRKSALCGSVPCGHLRACAQQEAERLPARSKTGHGRIA